MSESPSSAPGFEVTIGGGEALTQTSSEGGVLMLVLEDHVDMVDQMTLRMGGTEGQPGWSWKIGDEVTAKIGTGEKEFFKGQVVSMEPIYQVETGSSMNIRALDDMHKLGRGRQTRFFEEMKDSDVVTQVAQEAGLECSAEATEEKLPYILQRNESNVAFLKRLAARNNFLLRVEEGKLVFKKAQFSGGGGYKLTVGEESKENVRSLRMSFNSLDQVQKVVVRGWDITKKEPIIGEADKGKVDQIGSGKLGLELAGSSFGESTAYVTDVPVSSQAAANALAKTEINRLARQFARGTATIKGNETVRAGTMITVEGLQKGYNGDYYVLASRHIIHERTGYTTEFTFCATGKEE